MDLIKAFTNEQLKTDVPAFEIGDTVVVHNKIKEGIIFMMREMFKMEWIHENDERKIRKHSKSSIHK